jgi:16S rRNA A1518/A1519 N6-dimethyltransferase RsmA/KsgA/DIM1 with predicted DNA glycosylase/AP lyase activity
MLFIILIVFIVILAVVMALAIQGPPYVPSDDKTAEQVVKLAKSYHPKRILDMGSGDGKLVLILASQGYEVRGVELNPLLVWRSARAIKKAGLQDKATIVWGSFWKQNTADYDLVVIYLIKHIMPRLERKLKSELSSGSHIISNFFVFPNLKPTKRLDRILVYKV